MSKPIKILIDEMDDGWDDKIRKIGYDAVSKNYVLMATNYVLITL